MTVRRYFWACLSLLIFCCGLSLAQQKQEKKFPYVARVIGENVNYRAGAGVNHYRCGRLSAPETVVVTGEQFGFARIVPPNGSFSWVSQQFVDKKDDLTGEVIGDNVRVWAGSPYVSAIHSSSNQTELNRGDVVTFAGKPENNYYKILPPEGAYLWISAAHIEYVSPLSEYKQEPVEAADEKAAETDASPSQDKSVLEGEDIDLDKPASEDIETENPEPTDAEKSDKEDENEPQDVAAPVERTKQMKAYDRYLELSEAVQKEKEKPIAVQDYEPIKTELEQMAADEENGRVIAFAEALLDVVERYEVVQLADKSLREKDSELAKTRSEIRRDLKKELEKIGVDSDYVMTGTLARSYVYTAETGNIRYAIKNDNDSIVAYAIPVDAALYDRADRLVGKKVGLKGEVAPDPNTSKVLVTFLDVVELWQPEEE